MNTNYTDPAEFTYEDLEAFFAAEGWGCKCCGQLSSNAWWKISGDTYCDRCKVNLKAELGRSIKDAKIPNRKAGQAAATWGNSDGFGHQVAKQVQAEYADIYGTVIDGEVVVRAITA